jgi:GR25 family glycosyltransferase involved in LPS biosynthesis
MNECDLNEDIHQYPIRRSEPEIVVNTLIKKNVKMSSYTESGEANPEFFKTYFNKIYCINLSKRIHKWDSTDLRLRQKNIEATRFDAIDGDLFRGISELSTGEIGCLCSHLEVIKHAKLNNYNRILIFEDDVHLSKDFEKRILSIKNFSWKLLYLGASQYSWKYIDTSEDFYLSQNTLGTFAYAVDRSMFDELIEAFSAKNEQVDKILTRIQEKHYGECYTMYPNIVIADVRTSDIRSGRDIYSHSEKMKWNLSMFSAFDKDTKKVLLLPDTRGWAFDNIARAIIKYNPIPQKIYYDLTYVRDLRANRTTINTEEWDYVYIMFEGEAIIPPAKNIIRGCYSAFWLENKTFTPEYMSRYFSECGGAVFANEGLRDKFINNLPKNFPISVIHDASDQNSFYPIKYKKNKEFTAIFVGNTLRPIKNFGKIQKICADAGVALHVCKNIPNKEMVHEYNKVDLIINYSDFEGGPQTFIEAAMCEIPMLIRDTNQLAKLIPCFVGKNEEEFVQILTRLKNNRRECKKKGNEAYNTVIKNFTYKTVAKKFTDFLVSLEKT